MSKYQQQKEDEVEALRHQESFQGNNNTINIDILDTKVSHVMPGSIQEMNTSSLSIALGSASGMKSGSETLSRETLFEESSIQTEMNNRTIPEYPEYALADMKYRSEILSRSMLFCKSSSKIEADASEVQEHNEDDMDYTLLNEAYLLIKEPTWWDKDITETCILQQKTPLGNTVLHMAALHDRNSACVAVIAEKAPKLLFAKNSDGDTALHVAARAGNTCFLNNLLDVHLRDLECSPLDEILAQNKRGNSFIHEALLNRHKDVVYSLIFNDEDTHEPLTVHKEIVLLAALFRVNNQDKSILYLAIEAGFEEFVRELIKRAITISMYGLVGQFPLYERVTPPNIDPFVPAGKSPFLAAIMKQNREFLNLLLFMAPQKWVELRDAEGRTPLHYAASTGYINGVHDLLIHCAPCVFQRDKHGFYPLHLASDGGHVHVVKELLQKEYCPDPRELVDNSGRNFLHIAAASGKFNVLRYILKSNDNDLGEMINDQDANGNTPLHLATMHCHPKIVHALTWDKRVNLRLINGDNQTTLDVCMQPSLQNPSLSQRLTWIALKSAGVPYANQLAKCVKVPSQRTKNLWNKEAPTMDQYKDRVNTLILVSTLIITVTFAAGFTLPGGARSSDPGQGMALMLHRMWFKLFIICITISMYGAISVTIILIWAQLGDLNMAIFALNLAKYCLGVILATLSLAFLAGVHLVISDLNWLATTTLVMSVTFIIMLMLLYILIWLPSISNKQIIRLISYYPFLMLALLVETEEMVQLS